MRLRHNEPKIALAFMALALILVMASCSQPPVSQGKLQAFCESIRPERISLLELEPSFTDDQILAVNNYDSQVEEVCPS